MASILLVSDTHGEKQRYEELCRNIQADDLIHLGDIGFSLEDHVIAVQGNNDHHRYPDMVELKIADMIFHLIHGHHAMPKSTTKPKDAKGSKHTIREHMEQYGKDVSCDVLCFGHTHLQDIWESNNHIYVNPGSLGKCTIDQSCAIRFTIDKDFVIERIEWEETRCSYICRKLFIKHL